MLALVGGVGVRGGGVPRRESGEQRYLPASSVTWLRFGVGWGRGSGVLVCCFPESLDDGRWW